MRLHNARHDGHDADLITAFRLADPARPHIEELASKLACEVSALVALDEDELTTAVSAWGGSAELGERLGHRIPLIPPIGDAYVASTPPKVVERWLATMKAAWIDAIKATAKPDRARAST